ncbi:MAG TPA: alpha-ketoglutarate-dependent dioxygenase AlkB [Phycisphaerales bacterium]|nr:alpha-ketoglutarate-dependent dioxygenase AlkB [Phycisphaerales bacterium]
MSLFSGPVHLQGGGWYEYRREWLPNVANRQVLFDRLRDELHWRQFNATVPGVVVPYPRLECWYVLGEPRAYRYSGVDHPSRPMPKVLQGLMERLNIETPAHSAFNACFANLYRDQNDSIGWHSDSEPVLGPPATVRIATVSLGATRSFQLKHRESGAIVTLQLESGSLFTMGPGVQAAWVHRVPKSREACGERISLTFRRVA